MSQVCRPQYSPALMGAVMTDGTNPHLSLSLCLSAGASSQCRHGVRRGRATGGDVLRKAQHARQHSDRPLGARPIRNQELRRNQRGCAAVLPGGESLWHTWRNSSTKVSWKQSGLSTQRQSIVLFTQNPSVRLHRRTFIPPAFFSFFFLLLLLFKSLVVSCTHDTLTSFYSPYPAARSEVEQQWPLILSLYLLRITAQH